MIGNIKGLGKKPCICPTGKITSEWQNKKGTRVKSVVVEDPKRLPVPITISTYTANNPTIQFLHKKPSNFNKSPPAPVQTPKRGTRLCQWYRRRKAAKELSKLAKLEAPRRLIARVEKVRHDREAEFIEQLRLQEQFNVGRGVPTCIRETKSIKNLFQRSKHKKPKVKKQKYEEPKIKKRKYKGPKYLQEEEFFLPPGKKWLKAEKKRKVKKIKGTSVKPVAESRYASVKLCHKESFNDRFVNFCYRICCQFYCCVTIILIIGCIIILVF